MKIGFNDKLKTRYRKVFFNIQTKNFINFNKSRFENLKKK